MGIAFSVLVRKVPSARQQTLGRETVLLDAFSRNADQQCRPAVSPGSVLTQQYLVSIQLSLMTDNMHIVCHIMSYFI